MAAKAKPPTPTPQPPGHPDAHPDEAMYAELVLVDTVRANTWNQERSLDDDFMASIRAHGVLSPILVRPTGKSFGEIWEVIAGSRRLAASRACGFASIPAVVRDVDDATARQLTIIENVRRENLTPWQEAQALAELLEVCDAQAAAAALGWPAWRVRRRAKLLALSPSWKKALAEAGRKESAWPVAWLEEIVVLPHKMQDDILDGVYGIDDFDDLKRAITHRLTLLSAAPFNIDDATLCPAAGACSVCPKRTGSQPDLFPDDLASSTVAGDSCLDRECWNAKLKAHGEAQMEALRAKHGRNIPIVSTDTYPSRTVRDAYPGILGAEGYTKAKKTDAGAVPALAVAGPQGPYSTPKTVYMIPKGGRAASASNKAAGLPAKSMEQKRAELETRRWVLVGQKLQELLRDGQALTMPSPFALSAAAVTFGIRSSDEVAGDQWEFVAKLKGDDSQVLVLLLGCVCERLDTNLQQLRNTTRGEDHGDLLHEITEICTFFRVDRDALKASADAEIPEPKSWAKEPAAEAEPKATRSRKASANPPDKPYTGDVECEHGAPNAAHCEICQFKEDE